jgi:hypothetical protein
MKQFIFTLILILTVSNSAFSQTSEPISVFPQICVSVDSVYSTMKIKEFKDRNILFGVKQITEEVLSEKYSLCEKNAIPVMVEITRVGTPSTTFRIAGVGAATETTQILLKVHFGDTIVDGIGESATTASYAFIELKEGKVPFSKSSIGIAMKKAIIDAISKL